MGHAIGYFDVASGRNVVNSTWLHITNSPRPSLLPLYYSNQVLELSRFELMQFAAECIFS